VQIEIRKNTNFGFDFCEVFWQNAIFILQNKKVLPQKSQKTQKVKKSEKSEKHRAGEINLVVKISGIIEQCPRNIRNF
jgi:hypothetical protein